MGSKPIRSYVLDKNIFFTRFVSSQIHEDGRVFYAQMTSCATHYDVIYHPSPINSQYLNMSGLTALHSNICKVCQGV